MSWEYRDDPTDVKDADNFEYIEDTCAVCFERIVQPILKGIWYHKQRSSYQTKDHIPIPANPVVGLYLINRESKTGFRGQHTDNRKCKKHDRYWNELLGFKKIKAGWRHGHYYLENYIALCGNTIEIDYRLKMTSTAKKLEDTFMMCEKCKKIRLKHENIPQEELNILNVKHKRYY